MKLLNHCVLECNTRSAMQDQAHADSDHGKHFEKSLQIGQTRSGASSALSPSLQVQMTS